MADNVTIDSFIALIQANDSREFSNLILTPIENFDLKTFISKLDERTVGIIWEGLQLKCGDSVLGLDYDLRTGGHIPNLVEVLRFIDAVVSLAFTSLELDQFTPHLFTSAVVLHGLLLSLPSKYDSVKNNICMLCERWWKHDLPNKESLASQSFAYLLERSLRPKSLKKDIKRVWQVHEALTCFDLNNESSQELIGLLCHCLVSKAYLKTQEGNKFLAFILTINENFMESAHNQLKSCIVGAERSSISAYGDIYFRAWSQATGSILEKLEADCIQDLMDIAIHAKKPQSDYLAQILNHFHSNKVKVKTLDGMLVRLYSPILWRALLVPNSAVRANAATILIDVFPLYDPTIDTVANNEWKEKQLDELGRLLFDPCHTIRCLVVKGVCQICTSYWEVLPLDVTYGLMTKIINDLAWDSSSTDVRAAVIKGVTLMLDNPLSHIFLKKCLPSLKDLLHDTTVKIRLAFLDLLLKIKTLREIQYWDVASVSHLFARLEIDIPSVCKKIVDLLRNSFLPLDKAVETQVGRGLVLIRSNRIAARKFYQLMARHHLDITSACRLIKVIGKYILSCVGRSERASTASSGMMTDSLESFGENPEDGYQVMPVHQNQPELEEPEEEVDGEDDLSLFKDANRGEFCVTETATVAGFIETMVILWTVFKNKLDKPAYAEMKNNLHKWLSKALPKLLKSFQDPDVMDALFLLAGCLPGNMIGNLHRSIASKLRFMTANTPPKEYTPSLECLMNTDKGRDLLDIISTWVEDTMIPPADQHNTSTDNTRRRRTVQFADLRQPQPVLAMRFMVYLVKNSDYRRTLLGPLIAETTAISDHLRPLMKHWETRLKQATELSALLSDAFLLQGLLVFIKLQPLLYKQSGDEEGWRLFQNSLLLWCKRQVLHHLQLLNKQRTRKRQLNETTEQLFDEESFYNAPETSHATLSESLLSQTVCTNRGGGEMAANQQLIVSLLQHLLEYFQSMMQVGIADINLTSNIMNMTFSILQMSDGLVFVSPCIHLLLHMTKFLYYQPATVTVKTAAEGSEGEDKENQEPHFKELVPEMQGRLATALLQFTIRSKEQAKRVFPGLKIPVRDMLFLYYEFVSLTKCDHSQVTSAIVTSTVSELKSFLRKDQATDFQSLKDLPSLTQLYVTALIARRDICCCYVQQLHENVIISPQKDILACTKQLCTLIKKVNSSCLEANDVIEYCQHKLQQDEVL